MDVRYWWTAFPLFSLQANCNNKSQRHWWLCFSYTPAGNKSRRGRDTCASRLAGHIQQRQQQQQDQKQQQQPPQCWPAGILAADTCQQAPLPPSLSPLSPLPPHLSPPPGPLPRKRGQNSWAGFLQCFSGDFFFSFLWRSGDSRCCGCKKIKINKHKLKHHYFFDITASLISPHFRVVGFCLTARVLDSCARTTGEKSKTARGCREYLWCNFFCSSSSPPS